MEVSDSASRILAGLLEARTGQQLTMSRRWRIETALKGLMRDRAIVTLDQLITTLVSGRDTKLADDVVEALLNNETYFFRDRAPFDMLRDSVLPALRETRGTRRQISIWCAGVSTGQEVYSLAMMFAEQRDVWAGWTVDLLGTDVSGSAISRAREGVYTQFEVQRGLPVVQMVRWFEPAGVDWRLSPALRRDVRLKVHSILAPPPTPGKFDIILCRNLLLYFSADMRRAAFTRVAEAIAPDGMMMLGAGETVIGQTDRFTADPRARGLYRACPPPAAGLAEAIVPCRSAQNT